MPELDGLRALAVIAVVGFHLNLTGFGMGWLGVNLFFVISGFLITGILLDSKASPHYLYNFYMRRTLRIFPIYFALLSIVLSVSLIRQWNIGDFLYYLTYTQNFLLALSEWKPEFPTMLNHTWTLAVEEQFYLIWPLIIFKVSAVRLRIIVLTLFIIALAVRIYFLNIVPGSSLFFTVLPVQMDALAAGAGAALIVRSTASDLYIKKYALLCLLLASLFAVFLVTHNGYDSYWNPKIWTIKPSNVLLFSLFSIFSAALLLVIVVGAPPVSAVLNMKWLRHIGKISYGIYLYHYPVLWFVDKGFAHIFSTTYDQNIWIEYLAVLLKCIVTYFIALASFKLLETPFLNLKKKFSEKIIYHSPNNSEKGATNV